MQESQKTLFLILALSYVLVNVSGDCNTCQSNNVACVNATHFKVCYDNVRNDENIMDCGEGKVCTDLGIICFNEGFYEPSCDPTAAEANCRTCDGNRLFVCTSRTTFQMCNGNTLGPQVSTCPPNKVCSIDSGEFCVDECDVPGQIECNIPAP
ncbi:uncharacterized protein LOC115622492 [Scaptodrosophila lebanonensis]|uniref:Uncharacterized protein LOC115622492 n=1 Tax=Drosophila lebanonensis TaxID=7225 RepID=A0A6J2TBG2_DROLE|nr:uncharacterized protein LOC115622492 [Scaptodrosophila lebanonensis]